MSRVFWPWEPRERQFQDSAWPRRACIWCGLWIQWESRHHDFETRPMEARRIYFSAHWRSTMYRSQLFHSQFWIFSFHWSNKGQNSKFQIESQTYVQALADISTNCSQSIKHTCTVNPLTKYSSWINRNGVVNTYWSGTREPSETGCQCSIDGTCAEALNSDSICNCDTIGADLVDDGILTDKNSIPVKSLRYGGAMTIFSSLKYILGPFVCSGKARM